MLRFDRYLVVHARAFDLASGRMVLLQRTSRTRTELALFDARDGRTLIDFEAAPTHRTEIWDPGVVRRRPRDADTVACQFIELLDGAAHGAPRAFELTAPSAGQVDYLRLVLAREARVRGWVPIAADVLAGVCRSHGQVPAWLAERSLVIFADVPGISKEAALALWHVAQRDARPHVLVRTLTRARGPHVMWPPAAPAVVHDEVEGLAISVGGGSASGGEAAPRPPDASAEARARWQVILGGVVGRAPFHARAVQLAEVLLARGQLFEARAWAECVPAGDVEWRSRAAAVLSRLNEHGSCRASKGWEMVDDLVGVLQMCQDVEDEATALARVSAFVRERLQASSVAFIARDGASPRVLTRVGSTVASVDLALRAIDTGVPVAPPRAEGPVESACPVRHATEVIGALWCRWGTGMPVAPQQASTLLGIAAAAAAPSVRLALARLAPPPPLASPVPELVGESVAMATVREAIVRAAQSPFPVVVEGESGSGKELAARAIHARSPRRQRRFCPINCAALVDDLVEAELFGHARGAFTGANIERPGLFEDAGGGTLFMDEVAELSPRVQAKLLRVLQESEVRRVGETMVRKIDVRIVAATNRPLAGVVAAGSFRADLWYRLDVVRIALPPLRERIEDLPLLVRHLWHALAARVGTRAVLGPAAMAALAAYHWPGNIRELHNVLASLLVSAPKHGVIGPRSLPTHIARVAASEREATLAAARRQFEERYVRAALARAGGRTVDAARDLGVSRQGLAKLMSRLGIAAASRERVGP